jgi:hypothetical protein
MYRRHKTNGGDGGSVLGGGGGQDYGVEEEDEALSAREPVGGLPSPKDRIVGRYDELNNQKKKE